MDARLFNPLRKATRKNRFVKRDPEVIAPRPNVFIPMRTCLDVAKSVGYLIRSLRCLILLHPTFTTLWNLNELHLHATDKSMLYDAQYYRSIKNEQEVGDSRAQLEDDERPYVPGEEITEDKQLGGDIELVYALLGGPSEHQKEFLCLSRVDDQKEVLERLLELRFSKVEIARVKYTAYGERFQHTITFLKPPAEVSLQEIQRINDDVAALGEWVVPSKKENGFSVNYSLHTTRIALALAKEILETEAVKHLCELETRETEELVVRLQERQQLISKISEKLKEQETVVEAGVKHKNKLQEKWEKNCCFLTDRERELLVASQRVELEKIDHEVEQYLLKSKRKVTLMEEKCVGLARRRQLHPTVDSMWVFRFFDYHGNGKVPTSVLRSALFGLETHLSAAAVNESLLRLAAQYHFLRLDKRAPAATANVQSKLDVKDNDELLCSSLVTCDACAMKYQSCLWCASQLACQPLHSPCSDVEVGHCSSIFLAPNPLRFRVIYVGKRSGGPEALIQLHLAFLHWGFNSTLETRKKQVGGSLLPFFRHSYSKEFASFGVRVVKNHDYKTFLASAIPQDVLILTETWPCKDNLLFFKGGARQLQYHLTIQDRRFTYDISHMYIPDANPEACTIFTHTNFMSNVFLNQSFKSTLVPYVSPHIELSAAEFSKKSEKFSLEGRTIILYDGDAQFDVNSVASEFQPYLRKAASVKPHVLYELFKKSICVVDFGMPGLERLVLEASLFGSPVIINDELNGVNTVDFPVPSRFRIMGRNYTQLNTLFRELFHASQNVELGRNLQLEFSPFRQYVTSLKSHFHRSVRRYFSDSVHFLVTASRFHGDARALKILIASIFAFVPFATVTISFTSAEKDFAEDFNASVGNTLKQLYLVASVKTVVSNEQIDPPNHALYVVHVKQADCFIGSHDFVSILAVALRHKRAKDSKAALNVGDCFWFHERGNFSLPSERDSLFRPLDDFVAQSFAELSRSLASNSLWQAFFSHRL